MLALELDEKALGPLTLQAQIAAQQAAIAGGGGSAQTLANLLGQEEIERAIKMISEGNSYLDPRVTSHVLAPRQRLTKREREVIRLVAEGKTNKQIADKLRITERTVKFHMTSLFNKLGAENRAQAVAIAGERHLI